MARSDSFITGRIHCRRPLILIPTFRLQSGGGPYIARRVCRRDPLPRRPRKFSGRGPKLALAGGVRNLKGAKRTSEEERASAGRGCTERGTLNASTVENPIWSCGRFALLGPRRGWHCAKYFAGQLNLRRLSFDILDKWPKRKTIGSSLSGLPFAVRRLIAKHSRT